MLLFVHACMICVFIHEQINMTLLKPMDNVIVKIHIKKHEFLTNAVTQRLTISTKQAPAKIEWSTMIWNRSAILSSEETLVAQASREKPQSARCGALAATPCFL